MTLLPSCCFHIAEMRKQTALFLGKDVLHLMSVHHLWESVNLKPSIHRVVDQNIQTVVPLQTYFSKQHPYTK
jgi:hypothetical protein